jgi:predicted acyl esterase
MLSPNSRSAPERSDKLPLSDRSFACGQFRWDSRDYSDTSCAARDRSRRAIPDAVVFLPGHKIMVQVQSAWFPLYDRNPQTFVPDIFFAKPSDYQVATERLYHASGMASFLELPIVTDYTDLHGP